MSNLGAWLREELRKRGLTQNETAVYAGVGQATISDVLNKGHVPKVETLFRLADFLETPRERVLRLAGHLPPAQLEAGQAGGVEEEDGVLVRQLLDEFRQVPDEWKPVAVEQVATFRRLAELRPVRVIGEEEDDEDGAAEGEAAQSEAA